MNKWKNAFWICLLTLVIMTGFSIYSFIDQGVTITYMKEGYSDTENDLDDLSRFINETDLSKQEIQNSLRTHDLFEYMDFETDTISLERVTLIFSNNKLIQIQKQW